VRFFRVFRRVGAYYRDHLPATIVGSASVVASALISLQAPGVVRRAVDALSNGAPLAAVWRYAAIVAAIAAVSGVFLFLQRRLLVSVSRHLEHRLRIDLYAHLLRLPAGFYMRGRVGDLLTRAVSDIGAVRMAVGPALMYALNTLFVAVITTVLMIRISPSLTALTLAVLPLVALTTRWFGQRIHVRWNLSQESLSRYTARLQEHLVGMRVLRAYACEDAEIAALGERNLDYVSASSRVITLIAMFQPLLQALIGVSAVVVLGVGGNAVRRGAMTLGQFVEFNLYLVRMVWPMIAVGWVANLVQRGAASMKRIEEIFAQQPPADPVPAVTLLGEDGEGASIEVRDLTFAYPDAGAPAVAAVGFRAAPGERVALVGGVGSGKSTLLSLVPRLLEPEPGAVLVDGVDVRRLGLAELRRHVALVPQGAFLFSATLGENIALARPEATRDEIMAAALAAGLEADLGRFPDGLDTIVGERGVTLSGGQRQRVAIARALLARPRLLLLDDCLSAVDTQTERVILGSLPTCTLVFATHRLAAAEMCDRVLVLERGRVVESGTPTELAAHGGAYARMLALQKLEAGSPVPERLAAGA
jgi:ATP-binding cassette, subfamily B, multidrug efflux pump